MVKVSDLIGCGVLMLAILALSAQASAAACPSAWGGTPPKTIGQIDGVYALSVCPVGANSGQIDTLQVIVSSSALARDVTTIRAENLPSGVFIEVPYTFPMTGHVGATDVVLREIRSTNAAGTSDTHYVDVPLVFAQVDPVPPTGGWDLRDATVTFTAPTMATDKNTGERHPVDTWPEWAVDRCELYYNTEFADGNLLGHTKIVISGSQFVDGVTTFSLPVDDGPQVGVKGQCFTATDAGGKTDLVLYDVPVLEPDPPIDPPIDPPVDPPVNPPDDAPPAELDAPGIVVTQPASDA